VVGWNHDLRTHRHHHTVRPYWSLTLGDTTHDGIVWGYETPIDAAAQIAGMFCFYPDRSELTVGQNA
jgi:uncharacterized protein (DUF427 family)